MMIQDIVQFRFISLLDHLTFLNSNNLAFVKSLKLFWLFAMYFYYKLFIM